MSCTEPATASQQPTTTISRKTVAALMAYQESETNSERSSRPATLTTTASVTSSSEHPENASRHAITQEPSTSSTELTTAPQPRMTRSFTSAKAYSRAAAKATHDSEQASPSSITTSSSEHPEQPSTEPPQQAQSTTLEINQN